MTIPKPSEKIKRVGQVLAESIILVGILVIAFILGRISAVSSSVPNDIAVVYPPLVRTDISRYNGSGIDSGQETLRVGILGEPDTWNFAASKSGKIYYPKGCKSLDRVKPENRIYFNTVIQAETAGYSLSAACAQ